MEVERVTVKVKIGGISVEATAALDFREGRTKEDAAAAAYNLSRALQDSLEAGVSQGPVETPADGWDALEGHQEREARRVATAAPPSRLQAPPFCSIHQVSLEHHTNAKGSWWSHRLPDGSWCKGS